MSELRKKVWADLDALQSQLTHPLTVKQIVATTVASMGRFFGKPPMLCSEEEKIAAREAGREWMNTQGRELTQQRRIV